MSAMYDAGDTAAFFAALDTARSSSNFRTADYGLHVVAMRALLHGQIRSSGEATLKAEAYDSSHGSPPLPGETRLTVDTSAAWLLPSDPALLREIDSLLPTVLGQRLATDRPYPHLAQFYARAGRPDKARAMLGRMRAEVRDTALVRSWTLDIDDALGEIALAEQRGAEAVDEFRKGDRLPDGPGGPAENTLDFNLARAFDVANKQDSAIVYFERALTAPNAYRVNTEGRWLGGIYKRLGELYEARGDKTKAESYLTKFVTLWAKADPALQPQVADAKRRLARLRDREGR
jgi:hypothetical protein